MRVLVGMPERGSFGGPATCEPPFVAALRAAGAEVAEEVYVYGAPPGDVSRARALWRRVRRVTETALRLRRRALGESFDVIHLNTAFDPRALLRDAATLLLMPRGTGAVFLKLHGSEKRMLETSNPVWRALRFIVLRRADGVGVLSTEEHSNFVRGGVAADKVFVVKNAVEPPALDDVACEADEGAGEQGDGVPVLLFIARFIRAKGLLDVIRACAVLRDEGRRFRLVCVGDGETRAEAESEVARLGLSDIARFTGYVPEEQTEVFYRGSAALVFPTYHDEGFPMTLFRAVAAGLPIVTTPIRAAADYLREPENCLWVEPRNPPQLAERIAHLLDRPDVRGRMREANLALAAAFRADAVAGEYAEIYRELTERERRAGQG